MNVTALFIKALDDKDPIYWPYAFEGDWTEAEKAEIRVAIDSHVPMRVDAMFNNWSFVKVSNSFFLARRASWDMGGLSAATATELAEKVTKYYRKA